MAARHAQEQGSQGRHGGLISEPAPRVRLTASRAAGSIEPPLRPLGGASPAAASPAGPPGAGRRGRETAGLPRATSARRDRVWLPLAADGRPLRAGRFLARPNRFVAEVAIGGRIVRAHVPNSGRLTGVLAPGCRLRLQGPLGGGRLPYVVLAARVGPIWVGTNPSFCNRLFPVLWRAGLFPELGAGLLRAEVAWGSSRFDFAVGDWIVEVKSVTLAAGRRAAFPDAVTARGARHCRHLADLAASGRRAALVFIAQRGDVDEIGPDDGVDPGFGAALRDAAARGVVLLGCAVRIEPGGAGCPRRVPVVLDGPVAPF
jgi:sugar fermentation stimulation protein A